MCEHEYENANCTNCANGLGRLEYECAKTQGKLKEYCHERAEEHKKEIENELIAKIRVGLGKVRRFEYETNDNYVCIEYYKASDVLKLLSDLSN